jgi:dihydrofolate reductase
MPAATSRSKAEPQALGQPSARNVVLGAAVSLDGYIARTDRRVDWLIMDPTIDLGAYAKSFDVIIAGRKTLDLESGPKGGGGSLGKMKCFIISRSKPPGKRGGAEYVSRPPGELVKELKALPGKDIWLMGGGELAREFLKEDLVDRMDLGIMPVLLGGGIPLSPSGFPQRNFTLAKTEAHPGGIIMAKYERARSRRGEKR